MNLILVGPQGSGKGTQAELLSKKFTIPTVSVGQLIRDQIKQKTKLGLEAEKYVLSGDLVPSQLTNSLVKEELQKDKYQEGILLDGFPRDLDQAEFLETILDLDYLILIEISEEETVKRLSGRRVCECGETYHIEFKKPVSAKAGPKNDMVCDKCGKPLIQRKDDYPEAIKERLNVYHTQTEPIIDYYQKKGKVLKIDGEASIEEVFNRILNELKQKGIE